MKISENSKKNLLIRDRFKPTQLSNLSSYYAIRVFQFAIYKYIENWLNSKCSLQLFREFSKLLEQCTYTVNRPKLCRNCAFPQNLHTRKLGEVTAFFALVDGGTTIWTSSKKKVHLVTFKQTAIMDFLI